MGPRENKGQEFEEHIDALFDMKNRKEEEEEDEDDDDDDEENG